MKANPKGLHNGPWGPNEIIKKKINLIVWYIEILLSCDSLFYVDIVRGICIIGHMLWMTVLWEIIIRFVLVLSIDIGILT